MLVDVPNGEQNEVESDAISQQNDHENDESGYDENNDNGGAEIQRDAEQQAGPQSNGDTNAVQHDAGQGQNDDVQMTTEAGESDAGGRVDKENVQPQDVTLPSTVSLQQAPNDHQMVENPNPNRAKQCFKCVETFIQESAFIDHLNNFHGILMKNKTESNDMEKPGQYVLNPNNERKRLIPVGDVDDDGKSKFRVAKRKFKKPLSPSN